MSNTTIKLNHWLPKLLKVDGITWGSTIYLSSLISPLLLKRTLSHEMIHIMQIKKHGLFSFIRKYLFEYFIGRVNKLKHHEAYAFISFEKQAYGLQSLYEWEDIYWATLINDYEIIE